MAFFSSVKSADAPAITTASGGTRYGGYGVAFCSAYFNANISLEVRK
jgi:hypothetical protein